MVISSENLKYLGCWKRLEKYFFKEWKSLTLFEHQVPNKGVGLPFGGVSVPHAGPTYKFWTVSNWMFTLRWRRKALRDEWDGNPLRTLHSRMSHKSSIVFRSADWGGDGSHLTSTWWSWPHFWMCLSVCLCTISSWNIGAWQKNSRGTTGFTWSLKWPYIP